MARLNDIHTHTHTRNRTPLRRLRFDWFLRFPVRQWRAHAARWPQWRSFCITDGPMKVRACCNLHRSRGSKAWTNRKAQAWRPASKQRKCVHLEVAPESVSKGGRGAKMDQTSVFDMDLAGIVYMNIMFQTLGPLFGTCIDRNETGFPTCNPQWYLYVPRRCTSIY